PAGCRGADRALQGSARARRAQADRARPGAPAVPGGALPAVGRGAAGEGTAGEPEGLGGLEHPPRRPARRRNQDCSSCSAGLKTQITVTSSSGFENTITLRSGSVVETSCTCTGAATAILAVSGLGQRTRAAARLETTRPPSATRGCPHT